MVWMGGLQDETQVAVGYVPAVAATEEEAPTNSTPAAIASPAHGGRDDDAFLLMPVEWWGGVVGGLCGMCAVEEYHGRGWARPHQ